MDTTNPNLQPTNAVTLIPGSAVIGLFNDIESARQAIVELNQAGFPEDQINVAARDRSEQSALIDGTDAKPIADHGVVIPGLESGLMEGLARLFGGRIASGYLYGIMIDLGVPELQARNFERGFESGKVLVMVDRAIHVQDALEILQRNGADVGPGDLPVRPENNARP